MTHASNRSLKHQYWKRKSKKFCRQHSLPTLPKTMIYLDESPWCPSSHSVLNFEGEMFIKPRSTMLTCKVTVSRWTAGTTFSDTSEMQPSHVRKHPNEQSGSCYKYLLKVTWRPRAGVLPPWEICLSSEDKGDKSAKEERQKVHLSRGSSWETWI